MSTSQRTVTSTCLPSSSFARSRFAASRDAGASRFPRGLVAAKLACFSALASEPSPRSSAISRSTASSTRPARCARKYGISRSTGFSSRENSRRVFLASSNTRMVMVGARAGPRSGDALAGSGERLEGDRGRSGRLRVGFGARARTVPASSPRLNRSARGASSFVARRAVGGASRARPSSPYARARRASRTARDDCVVSPNPVLGDLGAGMAPPPRARADRSVPRKRNARDSPFRVVSKKPEHCEKCPKNEGRVDTRDARASSEASNARPLGVVVRGLRRGFSGVAES